MLSTEAPKIELADAWLQLLSEFPFPGYVKPDRRRGYMDIARTALRWVGSQGRILDYGAGPCDKTALLSLAGAEVVAADDLLDPWHRVDGNREAILDFAARVGIRYVTLGSDVDLADDLGTGFDMVMLHHVLEHLHDSPRVLLLHLMDLVRDGGYLFVTVPNAVNIRKRLAVLRGQTNYPEYRAYYWYPGPWRGHIREYVKADLRILADALDLRVVELRSYFHFWHSVPRIARPVIELLGRLSPGTRDSWLMVARKPAGWSPKRQLTAEELRTFLGRGEYYDYGCLEDEEVAQLFEGTT